MPMHDFDNPVPRPTGVGILGPTILLHGGTYFSFADPMLSEYSIDDIAHGLSLTCRFAGQCREFYSVAQHSVYASRYVRSAIQMPALLHDASEAFTGDMAKPLKLMLPEFKAVEDLIQADVYLRFCRGCELGDNARREIKDVDLSLLKTEQTQLMNNKDLWGMLAGIRELPITIKPWSAKKAKRKFLEQYERLRR